MNTDRVYIVPDTLPREAFVFPLVQLFSQVVHLLPVEEELPVLTAPLQAAAEQGLLHFHAPAPLGAERQGFVHLVQAIWQRPEEFTRLSLAGWTHPVEDTQAIQTALRRGRTANQHERLAWQARLLLKLSEYIQLQEEEMEQQLERIQEQEQKMLAELQDRAGEGQPELRSSRQARGLEQRCTAWKHLLSVATQPLPPAVLITTAAEVMEFFLPNSGEQQPLWSLPLPRLPQQDWLQQSADFRQQTAALRTACITHGTSPAAYKEWEQLLEQHYPTSLYQRCLLSFFPCNVLDSDGLIGLLMEGTIPRCFQEMFGMATA